MNIELRDYFAGKALQSLLLDETRMEIENIVITSFRIADKMMKERSKLYQESPIDNIKQVKNEHNNY